MKFEDAMREMRLGKKVKHPGLAQVWYTIERDDLLYKNTPNSSTLEQSLTRDEILSDKWTVIEENHEPAAGDVWRDRNVGLYQIHDIEKYRKLDNMAQVVTKAKLIYTQHDGEVKSMLYEIEDIPKYFTYVGKAKAKIDDLFTVK